MTNDLETTLAALVADAPVDRADWSDVTRRARRPQRRRALVLAVALALTTIAVATPAFGLGSRVLDLFEGTPATPEVQQLFADWNSRSEEWSSTLADVPPERIESVKSWIAQRYPRVDPSKAHGIFSVELSPSVVVQVWAAPISSGGVCSILLRADQAKDMHARGSQLLCITGTTPISPRGRRTLAIASGLGVVPGMAPGAASVEIRFADDTTVRAPVVEGFFVAPMSISRIVRGPGTAGRSEPPLGLMPTQVTSYDARGDQLAQTTWPEKVIADYLGTTVAELYDVEPGSTTLAQMAADRGRSVSGLVDAIVANAKVDLDAQVAAGQITATEEVSRLADRQQHSDSMVQGGAAAGLIPNPLAAAVEVATKAVGGATTPTEASSISIVSLRTVAPPQRGGSHPLEASLNVVTAASAVLVVEVTIHNGGDQRETDVPVTITIERPGRVGDLIESTATVDTIAPNETKTTTVTFDDLEVPFAVQMALRATVANGPVKVYPIIFTLPSTG